MTDPGGVGDDVPLMHTLIKALHYSSTLLIVGDIDQLPSVGPGQVLADIAVSLPMPPSRRRAP